MPVMFVVRDRDHPDYHPKRTNQVAGTFPTRVVTRKGQQFVIGNERLELFPVSVMAEALDRKNQTIIDWEKQGVFPKPMYALSMTNGKSKRRLYSAQQVINLHNLLFGKYQARKAATLDLKSFSQDIKLVFHRRFICVDQNGKIHPHAVDEWKP